MIVNRLINPVVICLLASACLLAACGGLIPAEKPVVTTWWLKPYVSLNGVTASDPVLQVSLNLSVVPGLDSDQVLALSDDAELKPYAGAHWADHLPELLTSLVGRSLEASGRFEINPDRDFVKSQKCDLQLEVQEFYADLDPGDLTTGVRVAIHGRLQCGSAVPVRVQASALIPVDDKRMTVIIAAFQQAMDQVMQEILKQI